MQSIPLALTYDDVLIVPRRSHFISRSEAGTKTRLTKKISLNIPVVSANMDTVTESEMCIAMARMGGIGIMHRFMTIEDNVEEIKHVKRAQNFVVNDPYTISPEKTIREAKQFIAQCGVSGILVADINKKLLGVLSNRDLLYVEDENKLVKEVMTPREKLIVGKNNAPYADAKATLAKYKIEKLPLVDENDVIVGLVTSSDVSHRINFPNASTDEKGRLIVSGSIGVHGDYLERAQALALAGADVLTVDIAHGHSELMVRAIKKLREILPNTELIVGNIATAEAAEELCSIGVDALKVGVGPGTTCITRLVTGCGVPQLTAVMAAANAAKKYNVPIIADGGIQRSGDIVKAIGAGADTVMCGGIFAGTKESPGTLMNRGGKKYKVCRGSASFAVAERRKKLSLEKKDLGDVVPEGVESVVPFKGPVKDILTELVGGLRSGMSYTDSHSIAELQKNCQFVQITSAGMRESGPHDLLDVK